MLVRRLLQPVTDDELLGLAAVLRDCVEGGASLGWVGVPSIPVASVWWARFLDASRTWIAVDDETDPEAPTIVGTVSMLAETQESGRHRGAIEKLLVKRSARGLGLATRLMAEAEEQAQRIGIRLLVLDTESGAASETMYRRMGWATAGRIEDYAVGTDGSLHGSTIMTKRLG
jgi:GNAT superfamily N-acetyltransferase